MSGDGGGVGMQRRLTNRRGSVAASDPWGNHATINLNPDRSSSSTLTIVKLTGTDSSPQRRQHRRAHSNQDSTRLSFAFSSFAASPPPPHPPSPRLRPASPARTSSFSKPRLTPDQLFDLARQSANPPRYLQSDSDSRPHSPITPPTFTPLPPSVYLPFIDRPAEVAALISTPPTVKLFSLLAQTFPKPNSSYSPSLVATSPVKGTLPLDPTTWSFDHLCTWLTLIDRDASPDTLWVRDTRRCILPRSELIWERVKGALGVPPELDVDDFSLKAHEDVFYDEDPDSNHWDDWDAVDSPLQCDRPAVFNAKIGDSDLPLDDQSSSTPTPNDTTNITPGGSPVPPPTTPYQYPYAPLSIEPLIADAATPSSAPSGISASTSALAPDTGAGEGLQDIAEGAEEEDPDDPEPDTPAAEAKLKAAPEEPEEKELNASLIHGLRISTALSRPPSLIGTASRPQSDAGAGSRLSSRSASFSSVGGTSVSSHSEPLLPPSLTHAHFYSHSQSQSHAHTHSNSNSPLAVATRLNSHTLARSLKRSTSLSSAPSGRRGSFRRADSFSSLRGAQDEDAPYDAVTERGPGNPLFPSNFARLALGPTLTANNANYRCKVFPPTPMYAAGAGRQYAAVFGSESSVGEKE